MPTADAVPLRVLLWRQDLLPGSETFVRQQASELVASERVDLTCVGVRRVRSVLSDPGDLVLYGDGPLEAVRRRRFDALHSSPRLDRLLRSIRPQVVHAHFVNEAFALQRVLRKHRIPLVVTAHGYDVTKMPQDPGARRQYERRLQSVLRSATTVVCVSRFIEERVLALAEARTVVHHTGIRLSEMHPGSPRAGVLFVGRLVAKKGLDDLIEALGLLLERGRRVPLTVVGDGPMRGEWERRAAALGIGSTFVGAQPPTVIADLMRHAQLFVAPSRTAADGDSEGLGHVFLEAQALELPVVSYAHGGVPEAVIDGRTGLLAQEGDVRGLAERIERVLADPLLAGTLGRSGREHVIRAFDIERQTPGLVGILERAALPG